MSIIQQALQAYLELAQHMHDEVCQSYQGDVMLAKQAMSALSQEAEPSAEGRAQKAERARDAMTNELGRLAVENAQLRALRFARFNNEECWIYQGDGEDHLESLVCPVVIAASTLLGIIVGPPKPAPLPQPVASVPQEDDEEEFYRAYNRLFSRRGADTKHMAECEEVWNAAIATKKIASVPQDEQAICRCTADESTGWTQWPVCNVCSKIVEGVELSHGAEIQRLTECLQKANIQAEHFERLWYLRGDEIEKPKSAPHGLEEFIAANREVLPCAFSMDGPPFRGVSETSIRTWMAGHARVPVESSDIEIEFEWSSKGKAIFCRDGTYFALKPEEFPAMHKAMLAASQQEGV